MTFGRVITLTVYFGGMLMLPVGCADQPPDVPSGPTISALASGELSSLAVSTIALNPTDVIAGATSTATVTLTAAAPSGGTVVGVASNNTAVATVPSSVTVPAGSTTASFTVTSHPIASPDFAAISATAGQVTQTAVLNVSAGGVTLSGLSISSWPSAGSGGSCDSFERTS